LNLSNGISKGMFKTNDQTFPFSRPFCVWNTLDKIFCFWNWTVVLLKPDYRTDVKPCGLLIQWECSKNLQSEPDNRLPYSPLN
jgi:hypothetical protein